MQRRSWLYAFDPKTVIPSVDPDYLIVYAICRLFVLPPALCWDSGRSCVRGFYRSIFKAGVIAGLSWLAIAFLISPYGSPMAAAWLTGKIGGLNYALRDFFSQADKQNRFRAGRFGVLPILSMEVSYERPNTDVL